LKGIFKGLILFFIIMPLNFIFTQSGTIPLTLRCFPVDSHVFIDGSETQPQSIENKGELRTFLVDPGVHILTLSAVDYTTLSIPLNITDNNPPVIEEKLEKIGLPLYQLGELPTAVQPKSVTFSPNGQYMAVASLGSSRGLQIFSLYPFAHVIDLIPPEKYATKTGFVESCWLPVRNEVWVSQMNIGGFHVFDTDDWHYKGTWDGGGLWSKVLLVNHNESLVYLSHWASETVSEIDAETKEVLRTFRVSGIPRGLTFSPDRKTLIVAIYSLNALDSIDLATGEVTSRQYSHHEGAMRHLITDGRRGVHYVTNMLLGVVYAVSDRTGDVSRIYRVGSKPNTAEMTPDGRYLFVSCRGPNNPKTYLIEGPEYGKVYVIDLERQEVLGWIWGRDQTTGLDVSPDSRYLAFTDFKDNRLELYKIQGKEVP
jgi:DNA-binding beta-propeller fold protein YncE